MHGEADPAASKNPCRLGSIASKRSAKLAGLQTNTNKIMLHTCRMMLNGPEEGLVVSN